MSLPDAIRLLTTRSPLLMLLFAAACCSSPEESASIRSEPIRRKAGGCDYKPAPWVPSPRKPYPWETISPHNHPRITKDFFRCQGMSLNPIRSIEHRGESIRLEDCGGADAHGLPLSGEEEWIPQILLELLNYIQDQSEKRVVITCGHRCPKHHQYVLQTPYAKPSKHLMGAEVNFYIQGLEDKPEAAVRLVQKFYQEDPETRDQAEYTTFERYEKSDTDVSTKPWFNKEIFMKLYLPFEGRNFDNRHPYPYLSIQVRYDRKKNKRLLFHWGAAEKNFLRH